MDKAILRKIYLANRRQFSSEQKSEFNRKICAKLFKNFDFTAISFFHGYLPIEKFDEVETKQIFEKIWRDFPHIITLVPRVDSESNRLENVCYNSHTALAENSWGISEPLGEETFASGLIDAVLVPLLCFDESGFRVGYGKGFYDGFLKDCRPDCLKIGVSQFPPVAKIEDINPMDIPLDYCITPEKIYAWQR